MTVTVQELKSAKRELERHLYEAVVPLLKQFRDEAGVGIESVVIYGDGPLCIEDDPALSVPEFVEVKLRLDF